MSEGFEEIEAVTIIDVLRRAGAELKVFGVEGLELEGAHKLRIAVDGLVGEAAQEPWDLVVLPGGMPNASTLRDNPEVQALLRAQADRSGRVAAICAAPIALAKAGLLEGKQATCYPGFEAELGGATHQLSEVVSDGLLTTSRGPGTAMAFSLSLVAQLFGREQATRLASQLLVS